MNRFFCLSPPSHHYGDAEINNDSEKCNGVWENKSEVTKLSDNCFFLPAPLRIFSPLGKHQKAISLL